MAIIDKKVYVKAGDVRQFIKLQRGHSRAAIKSLRLPSNIAKDKANKIYGWESRLALLQDLEMFLNESEARK